jgi:hypothetical protein
MRITRDSLMSLARDFAALRFREDRDLVCIYLTGSMCLQNPMLGGTTDIDLIFVHAKDPAEEREIQRINDDVSFDIAHLPQSAFEQPRHLRFNPWLGSFLCENPIILKENQHWFEFTQAAVCAHFNAPETVLARVKPQADNARRIWFSLQNAANPPTVAGIRTYLKAVEAAVNSCALLFGPPLTERRFLLDFANLAEKVNQPMLPILANSLVCDQPLPEEFWKEWVPIWKNSLTALRDHQNCPKKLSFPRQNYYLKACDALRADNSAAALWVMLRTWSQVEEIHPQPKIWGRLISQTGFDAIGLGKKLERLDHFLDMNDEMFEKWARFNGL